MPWSFPPTGHETGRLRAFVRPAVQEARRMGGPDRAMDRLWAADRGREDG